MNACASAALSIVTDTPRIRSVAIAQDHATSIARQSVRDASSARISTVIGHWPTLAGLRLRPPTGAALLGACSQEATSTDSCTRKLRAHRFAAARASTGEMVRGLDTGRRDEARRLGARSGGPARRTERFRPGLAGRPPHRDATDASAFVRAPALPSRP